MRAELADLYHCAVPILSRAVVNLNWYDNILTIVHTAQYTLNVEYCKLKCLHSVAM